MLVLQRRAGESIVLQHPAIGDVTITLVGILGTQRAKIGVIAPRSVNIKRSELSERSQQGEEAPETFYKADRERAKAGLTDYQLAYVERLEMALRASDEYVSSMCGLAHTPAQYALESNLLTQMSKVNFLSSCDHLSEQGENELPRDVIFK